MRVDGAHTIHAIVASGPVVYSDEKTGALISLDLFRGAWIWWTRIAMGSWEPQNATPAEDAAKAWAEGLLTKAQDIFETNGGI